MLLQFSAENFMSIRDKVTLNLEPSADKEHKENIVKKNKYKANKIVAIYGANASGKTALYKALTFALVILRLSNVRQINEMIAVMPFKLDDTSRYKPTKFEFVFVANDGLKYVYGYSADMHKVREEYLYCYKSAKPSVIFTRNESEYKFARFEKKYLEPLVRMNTDNKLFLATATAWNVESTMIPYKWLSEGIDAYTGGDGLFGHSLEMYRIQEAENVAFTKKLLKCADINIDDIRVESKLIKPQANMPLMGDIVINGQLVVSQERYEIKIETGHTVKIGKNKEKRYTLGFYEESLGTQVLFYLAPLLRQTFEMGKVLVIDEIDTSLHPYIVKFLIDLFRNKEINPSEAQLIFTTHETTLLSLDTFRRDEIYFAEKNARTGVTDLYSLERFAVRKNDNIEKGYLNGKYGAVPFMRTENIV